MAADFERACEASTMASRKRLALPAVARENTREALDQSFPSVARVAALGTGTPSS